MKKSKKKIKEQPPVQPIEPQEPQPVIENPQPHPLKIGFKILFWFMIGIVIGLFLIVSFAYFVFQKMYEGKIYPGVMVNGMNFSGKSPSEVSAYFQKKNAIIDKSNFTFVNDDTIATMSAKSLHIGYNANLLATQAYDVGRSSDTISNLSLILQAFTNGVELNPSYTYDENKINNFLTPLAKKAYVAPVNAIFQADSDGRVRTFAPSTDGKQIDVQKAKNDVNAKVVALSLSTTPQNYIIKIPAVPLHPTITTESANNLGIKELIGTGTSLFQGSIDSRIYNVELGASRANGVIIKPGEVFSFDQAIGDVSSLTGYKQAYVIQGGHTVLGDGGGICQVSTTLFRAALNAGLPIVERHAHDYRVHYYEEDGPPGIDATIYTPTVDLKFKNDTGHAILVQSIVDPDTLRLTFNLYGTSDGRQVTMTTPVVTNEIPAPPALYQDDPTLPAGTVKQTDFSADGATVSFSRTVTKDGKVIINDTYKSVYRPWQAVFLRGTKT